MQVMRFIHDVAKQVLTNVQLLADDTTGKAYHVASC